MRSLQSSLIMPFTVSFSSVSSSLNPFRKNGHKNTTVRVHRGLTVIQLPAGAFRVLSEHHNNLAQPADVAERHSHHRYLGRIVRRIYGR